MSDGNKFSARIQAANEKLAGGAQTKAAADMIRLDFIDDLLDIAEAPQNEKYRRKLIEQAKYKCLHALEELADTETSGHRKAREQLLDDQAGDQPDDEQPAAKPATAAEKHAKKKKP